MDFSLSEYTVAAQSVLTAAQQEAANGHAAQIEPEHVLLGLLSPAAGTVWSWLAALVRDPQVLRTPLLAALADTPQKSIEAEVTLSYRTNRVLSEAAEEARRMTSDRVDTPHLLLGLMDEGGAAAQILRQYRLDARTLRYWLKTRPPTETTATPPVLPKKPRDEALYQLPLRQALPRLISWRAIGVMLAIVLLGGWMTTQQNLEQIGIFVFILGGWIVSVSAHEFAHAFVADLGGDHSVRENGYLSFNPLKYTHLLLSVIMPVIFLLAGGIPLPGGAVYINRNAIRSPKWHSAVSAAGPLASLLMAVLMSIPFFFKLISQSAFETATMLWAALAALIMLNIAGVLLNLLPIPPLDGFGIIAPWLNPNIRNTLYGLSNIGFLVVFLLISTSEPVNQVFWDTVYNILQGLHVSPFFAQLGLGSLMFWR